MEERPRQAEPAHEAQRALLDPGEVCGCTVGYCIRQKILARRQGLPWPLPQRFVDPPPAEPAPPEVVTVQQSGNRELSALWLTGAKGRAQAIAWCARALRDHQGNVVRTAQYLRVDRMTLTDWIRKPDPYGYPELHEHLLTIRQEVTDARAEAKEAARAKRAATKAARAKPVPPPAKTMSETLATIRKLTR